MSPRHFSNRDKFVIPKTISKQDLGPNLWYAFTRVTGIADLFVFTPKQITNKINSSQSQGIKE